jgi:hypothetical protein
MQRLILVIGILALVVGTVLYIKSKAPSPGVVGGGKPPAGKKNNLQDVDCKAHGAAGNGPSGKVVIAVNATNGIDFPDEGVFACTGEKVSWQATSGVKSMDIYFPSAQEWPFKGKFVSDLSGTSANPTDEQEVATIPAGYRMKAFKYRIHVETDHGPIVPDLDPHFIPMGP